MATSKYDLPRGIPDQLILKAVAADRLQGYAVAQRIEQVSRGVVKDPEGSLYAALHKKTETGREAKFYRLTRKGRK